MPLNRYGKYNLLDNIFYMMMISSVAPGDNEMITMVINDKANPSQIYYFHDDAFKTPIKCDIKWKEAVLVLQH